MSIAEMDEDAANAASPAVEPDVDGGVVAISPQKKSDPRGDDRPADADADDDGDENEGGVDDEDDLFAAIEEEQHQHEEHDGFVQSHDAKAAPKLLQKAIEKGEVGVDDSEVESDEEYRCKIKKEKEESSAAAAAAAEADEGGQHHLHHRVS
jgi:hypothetical protein